MSQGTGLPLGFYQLNNLITSRVPFLILKIDVDFAEMYGVMEMMHLRNYGADLDKNADLNAQAIAAINERHIPKDYPIIIVCRDGKHSQGVSNYLDSQGYTNTFYLLDGFNTFKEDIEKSKTEEGY